MSTEDRHPSVTNPAPAPGSESHPAAPAPGFSAKGSARRRFTRAGAGATGVLLTLYSQPGMASTYCGMVPSAAMSAMGQNKIAATMSHHPVDAKCNGVPPNAWAANTQWPAGSSPNDFFYKYFSVADSSPYYKETCGSIVKGADCDVTKVGQYVMAAYLNILAGNIDFLPVEKLKSLWTEWSTNGYYEPTAGQKWVATDIVKYLAGIMD